MTELLTAARPAPPAPTLSRIAVVVPVRNEAEVVEDFARAVVAEMHAADLPGLVVFADDSDDATPQIAAALADEGLPVVVHHRPREQRAGGICGAVLAAVSTLDADVVAVMDADFQHPPSVLPALLAPVLSGSADVAVGSRYVSGGANAGLDGVYRRFVSRSSAAVTRVLFRRVRTIRDPLSGLFAARRDVLTEALGGDGFKICLEVLVLGRWERAAEVGYHFQARAAGTSKAGLREGLRFAAHLRDLRRRSMAAGPDQAVPGWAQALRRPA